MSENLKPFVLYHEHSDHSAGANIIYVGTDKASALDALLKFIASDSSQSNEIHMKAAE